MVSGDERGLRLSHSGAVSFKSKKRGVQAARNGPSADRKCWQRVELGTQWTEQMSRKMLRNVEKRGVHTARNGPSPPPTPAGGPGPSRSLARRIALVQGNARLGPPTLWHQCQLVQDPLSLELNRRLVVKSRLSEIPSAVNASVGPPHFFNETTQG